MCVNSKGSGESGESARIRKLAWSFAGCPRDKYHNIICWLNSLFSSDTNYTNFQQKEFYEKQ